MVSVFTANDVPTVMRSTTGPRGDRAFARTGSRPAAVPAAAVQLRQTQSQQNTSHIVDSQRLSDPAMNRMRPCEVFRGRGGMGIQWYRDVSSGAHCVGRGEGGYIAPITRNRRRSASRGETSSRPAGIDRVGTPRVRTRPHGFSQARQSRRKWRCFTVDVRGTQSGRSWERQWA